MAKSAATEQALGDLHAKIARVMTNALNVVEKQQERFIEQQEIAHDFETTTEEAGILPPDVNPALLSVITRFLNENKISCVPEEGTALGELDRILQEKKNKRAGATKRVAIGNVVQLHEDE